MDWKSLFFQLANALHDDVVIDRNENHSPENGRFTSSGGSNYHTKVFVDNETKKQYNKELRKSQTSDGKSVKSVSGHAVGRMIERKVPTSKVKDVLA